MKRTKKQKSGIIRNLLIALLSVIIVLGVVWPLPYYIEMPGSAENVRDFVSVDGKRDKNSGSFMLTTVGIRQGTTGSLLAAYFSPFQEIISKKDLMGENSNEEYDQLSQFQMTSSENMAKKVALDLAKEPYEFDYKGVYVMSVSEKSSFYRQLKTGDVVYQIDETRFENSQVFMKYIQTKTVGNEVTIHFTRDGKDLNASGKLIELAETKQPGIGITLVDHSELKTPKDVQIKTTDIGGPSAGLMFTLELYGLLTEQDLRQGREIAGTGTINADGTVGSIGGIDKKVVAADREGATVFFAPAEELAPEIIKQHPELKDEPTNYEEALAAAAKIKTKMEIVPVKSVQDALDYLAK